MLNSIDKWQEVHRHLLSVMENLQQNEYHLTFGNIIITESSLQSEASDFQ